MRNRETPAGFKPNQPKTDGPTGGLTYPLNASKSCIENAPSGNRSKNMQNHVVDGDGMAASVAASALNLRAPRTWSGRCMRNRETPAGFKPNQPKTDGPTGGLTYPLNASKSCRKRLETLSNGRIRKSESAEGSRTKPPYTDGPKLKPPNAEAAHLSLKPVYDSPASQTRRISAHMVRQRSLNNPHWTQKTHKKPTYDKGLKTLIETSLQLIRAPIEIRLHFTNKPNSRLRPFPNASPAFATAGGRRICVVFF